MARPVVLAAGPLAELVPADETILRRRGLELSEVETARAAIHSIRTRPVGLLLLGPELPDTSIETLVRDIRATARLRHVSILVVGDPAEKRRFERIVQAGANALIWRPIEGWEFDAEVARLLEVEARAEVRVSAELVVEGLIGQAKTCDLSSSGMLLETESPLDIGATVSIRFALPGDGHDIPIEAVVVRSTPVTTERRQIGLRFLDLDDGDRKRIDEWVAKTLRDRFLRRAFL